jgi:hypothetical protein
VVRSRLGSSGSTELANGFRRLTDKPGCAVKAVVHSGSYPHGNSFAPLGGNQSSGGGNETAEASGAEGRHDRDLSAAIFSITPPLWRTLLQLFFGGFLQGLLEGRA